MSDKLAACMVSAPMVRRDRRLRDARVNADRTQRELRRDRGDLERKERHLMGQLRNFAGKGDLHKAKCLAHQVAHYRVAADRNFDAGVMIDTRAQLMVSNHVVNRAEVEAIKGIRYANKGETIQTALARQHKYDMRLTISETMEAIMNEGMDDVYEWGEEQRPRHQEFADEATSTLKQGTDAKWPREYFDRDSAFLRGGVDPTPGLHVILRVLPPSDAPAPAHNGWPAEHALRIPTLDISVDMLQRLVLHDPHALRALSIPSTNPASSSHASSDRWRTSVADALFGTARAFRVGSARMGEDGGVHWKDQGEGFVQWSNTDSLKARGVRCGSVVWLKLLDDPPAPAKGGSEDGFDDEY
ncbi:hypothetical protein HKX48_009085 [Thoreauomyces humboldtii]|nr:hypothetical protein HKX48_009085 [Thoreauomyces humboldtii]